MRRREARRRWRDPPLSTLPFWRHEQLIRSHAVNRRFIKQLSTVYEFLSYELRAWPLQEFHAIDLFAFIEAQDSHRIGQGEYLITTNARNEKQFFKRDALEPYQPVIVIGLDDEKNLFRAGIFYRALVEYTWKPGPRPPLMSRPLGAFIYFLKSPPEGLGVQAAHFALTESSFRLVADDPLAPLRDLEQPLYETLTFRNGCVSCHSLRGVGSQSHHLVAQSGESHGGLALPLESYPPEVWRSFLYDQEAVATKIGASPNIVAEPNRRLLYDLVNDARRPQDPGSP